MTTEVAFQSFGVQAGQDIDLQFTVRDKNAAIVDLTGFLSFRFVMSRGPQGSAIVDKTGTISDAPNGIVDVALSDTETDAFTGDYYYELKGADAGNNESVSARGYMSFSPSNTSG